MLFSVEIVLDEGVRPVAPGKILPCVEISVRFLVFGGDTVSVGSRYRFILRQSQRYTVLFSGGFYYHYIARFDEIRFIGVAVTGRIVNAHAVEGQFGNAQRRRLGRNFDVHLRPGYAEIDTYAPVGESKSQKSVGVSHIHIGYG